LINLRKNIDGNDLQFSKGKAIPDFSRILSSFLPIAIQKLILGFLHHSQPNKVHDFRPPQKN